MSRRDSLDVYQDNCNRIESNVGMMDQDATHTSIAISLKRIADNSRMLGIHVTVFFTVWTTLLAYWAFK